MFPRKPKSLYLSKNRVGSHQCHSTGTRLSLDAICVPGWPFSFILQLSFKDYFLSTYPTCSRITFVVLDIFMIFFTSIFESNEAFMRIVSWNCNGKFREKFEKVKELNADIYVIQECEDPQNYVGTAYGDFAKNDIWNGENKNKGLGIFAKEGILIENNRWETYCLRNFLSVKVNHDFDLLGVWACKPYIEEYYIYQCINIEKFNDKTIIIGDFNSNKIWDKRTA